ncbi:MAG: SOS response-associated peptidase family protein [Burkholderiaceae bacterium]
MCTNYTSATPHHLLPLNGLGPASWPDGGWPEEAHPGYLAPIWVAPPKGENGMQGRLARFGLVPRWCRMPRRRQRWAGHLQRALRDREDKPSFRDAWREKRFAVVPMLNYLSPAGKADGRCDGALSAPMDSPMLAAALHERWVQPETGEAVHSFTLLTTNADAHPLLNRMHRPGDEKRQLRLLEAPRALDWLRESPWGALDWLGAQPPVDLVGQAAPLREDPQGALPF